MLSKHAPQPPPGPIPLLPSPHSCAGSTPLPLAASPTLRAQVPLALGNIFLVARAAFCVAANLTVCELLTRKRYAYLTREATGAFVNPFDRGAAANCLQFWSGAEPDWASELLIGRQVCGEVVAGRDG